MYKTSLSGIFKSRMLPLSKNLQKGYVTLALIVFALIISVLIFPFKFPAQNLAQNDGFRYCREFINDPNAQEISVPGSDKGSFAGTYKMIKQNVPVKASGFEGEGHHIEEGPSLMVNEKNFQILYPTSEAGRSYDFNTEDGIIDDNGIIFAEYGLIFLRHLDENGNNMSLQGGKEPLQIIDIYQDVTKPPMHLAENILKCVDEGIESVFDPQVIIPEQSTSEKKDQVQLEYFIVKQAKLLPKSWWTPECKPAIYLYPGKKQLVNVKVFPAGELTYVDPPYDLEKGWTVWASPNGALQEMNDERFTIYDYLYYESKIRDEAINKPNQGWVVEFNKLEDLYNEILPKLGLNEKEIQDFVDYWTKSLPEAPYYFVGIVDQDNINEIEKIEITPKPDSINRVRVYFERLDSWKSAEPPMLTSNFQLPTSNFHVTEWGGIVKTDPNHPFTCSQ